MTRRDGTLPASYFEDLYATDPDPWRFATSEYEGAKYDATLAALPRDRYASALEVGCSIGVLTRALSERCDALLAVDLSREALDQARARCIDRPGVRFDRIAVPDRFPDGPFDLVLLSEVVYYLDRADVDRLAGRVRDALAPGGDVVLVHWTGETDYPLSGDEAAECFMAAMEHVALPRHCSRTDRYRLDVLTARNRDA